MKRAVVLLLLGVVALAGCGGRHTTNPQNTGSRNVAKPLVRPLVVKLVGSARGTARVRSAGSKATTVSVQLAGAAPSGATAELAKGSCGTPTGLQSLTQLTASPLAVVIRAGGKVVACGQVRQG